MSFRPTEIRKDLLGLKMTWTGGQETSTSYAQIRQACACAVCKEMKVPLSEDQPYFYRATSLEGMKLVGNYAVEILWGDGHRSIMPFEKLYELKNPPHSCACGKGGCGKKENNEASRSC